jgi:hypothetical protein
MRLALWHSPGFATPRRALRGNLMNAGNKLQEHRSSRGTALLFWGVLASALVGFLVERSRIGLRRPVPWPDEGSFLWQALAFRDHWTLFAPELNPTRHVLWMPPGFMVLEGTIFKLVPFSLGASRSLSALFLCGAFACLAASFRHFRSALGLLAIAVMFLFSPIFLFAGNVARMESLVLCLTTAGFLLLARKRTVGLAVLALAPLVHPNGLFACAGGAAYFFATARERRPMLRFERVLFVLVAFAWVAYGVYVHAHFQGFLDDMRAQLRFKEFTSLSDGGPAARAQLSIVVVPTLLLVVAVIFAQGLHTATGALATLSAVFFAQTVLTAGWLYEVYAAYAVLLATTVVVESAAAAFERTSLGPVSRRIALVVACATAAVFGHWAVRAPFVERAFVQSAIFRPTLAPEYFTNGDYEAVANYLTLLEGKEGPISVQVIPDGEALLFERLRSNRLSFVQQTFYESRFDVAIVHESVWFPKFVHDLEVLHVLWLHAEPPETVPLRSRDGTERILAYRWRPDR